ncbi:2,3-bisphosphoglycerate-independent phosphoglycerate mutase [Candidatus Berkelbacteria bacterium]|nr:2,3-bisphosphoglycerate-independent phosphoglycerate mutase [Candidatus Berkelbacteria bacterium]
MVFDGFGLSPATKGNALYAAKTPTLDRLVAEYPYVALTAHGTEVGLRWGEMGNSEVGHLNLGAGRVVLQEVTKIFDAIETRQFFENQVLKAAFAQARDATVHLIGLASNGGVHGHVDHLTALVEFARREEVKQIVLHLVADGRDAEPTSLRKFLGPLEAVRARAGAQYGTLVGRYYAMDRDRHWDRTQAAYQALVAGEGEQAATLEDAIVAAYGRKESDEFIKPTVLGNSDQTRIKSGDVVVMANFRSDRARQLALALAGKDFTEFVRPTNELTLVTFTNYGVELVNHQVAFPVEPVEHSFAAVLAEAGLRQLHIAETEKYAHVTYFFNGGVEEPFPGEKRLLIASPKVATYDTAPAMSADKITAEYLEAYEQGIFDVAIVNFANPDMVGHTGEFNATVEALEALDGCLTQIVSAVEAAGDALVITGDHGKAEQLIHPDTGDIDKEHTANPVPLLLVDPTLRKRSNDQHPKLTFLSTGAVGILADVAPTILDLLKLPQPREMTGRSLLTELRR